MNQNEFARLCGVRYVALDLSARKGGAYSFRPEDAADVYGVMALDRWGNSQPFRESSRNGTCINAGNHEATSIETASSTAEHHRIFLSHRTVLLMGYSQ